jgi:hypothetical protein
VTVNTRTPCAEISPYEIQFQFAAKRTEISSIDPSNAVVGVNVRLLVFALVMISVNVPFVERAVPFVFPILTVHVPAVTPEIVYVPLYKVEATTVSAGLGTTVAVLPARHA